MPQPSSSDLFDEIAIWKADAVDELQPDGDDRFASVSPGPAFPAVLRTIAGAVPAGTQTIVDLGAGIGGASAWFQQRTGARVIAIEPAKGSRVAAGRLFPQLDVMEGSAHRSGLPDACADVVLALGVVSLLDDLHPFLGEARRLLRDAGVIGIADMFLADGDQERRGINTLRSLEFTLEQLIAQGFAVKAVGCASDPGPDEAWARAADRVSQHVLHAHPHDPAVEAWRADVERIGQWMSDGDVIGACIVFAPG